MTDEPKNAGTESDGIVFNPPSDPISPSTAAQPIAPPAPSPSATPVPSAAPASAPAPAAPAIVAPDPRLNADIAKILQEVQLPERHDHASAPASSAVVPSAAPPVGSIPEAPLKQTIVPPVERLQPIEENAGVPRPVVSLHTMKTDLQDVVRHDKISLVRAASMQAERHVRKESDDILKPRRDMRRVWLILVASFIALALGAAALYAVYYLQSQKSSAQAVPTGLLFAEQQVNLPIDTQSSAALRQTLATALTQAGSVGSVTEITPIFTGASGQSQHVATLSEFFLALGIHAPDELMRALDGSFFLGVHAADVPSPVLVIPVISYDHAFSGMLAWEQVMDSDLSVFFKQVSPFIPAESSTTLPTARTFEDGIMRDYDVRELKDDSGNIVFYYSFPTPQILIIAASPYTFPEVLSRLQAQRKL